MGNFENFVKFTAEYLILNRSQTSCARDCTSNACMQIESMLFNFSKKNYLLLFIFVSLKKEVHRPFGHLLLTKITFDIKKNYKCTK